MPSRLYSLSCQIHLLWTLDYRNKHNQYLKQPLDVAGTPDLDIFPQSLLGWLYTRTAFWYIGGLEFTLDL